MMMDVHKVAEVVRAGSLELALSQPGRDRFGPIAQGTSSVEPLKVRPHGVGRHPQ